MSPLSDVVLYENTTGKDAAYYPKQLAVNDSQSKLTTVRAMQSIGFETVAAGDSYNDLDMLLASRAGFLFRTTEKIRAEYPQLPAYETYGELLDAIRRTVNTAHPV